MKYIDAPSGCFVDRRLNEPNLKPVDVGILTLDADAFLEKSLYTFYREIPIRKLFVCDGGSKDKTLEILENFPRVVLHYKPEIRTTGKAMEFLFSIIETEWFVFIDADIELMHGWYDEMCKNQTRYGVLENSRRILAYHFYREDKNKLMENSRSLDMCHLIKKDAVKGFHCDDDYMWRVTDYLLRQVAESSGYKYGKIDMTVHIHNETERIPYESDNEKNFYKVIWKEPEWIVLNKKKAKLNEINRAKAIVKYLDPDSTLIRGDKGFDTAIRLLDRKWIAQNGPKWLERHKRATSISFVIKNFIYRHLIQSGKNRKSK